MAGFMPTSESEKRKWYLSIKENLSIAERQLNVPQSVIQYLNDNIDKSIRNIDLVSQQELNLAAAKETRNEHRDDFSVELNKIFKRWKNDENYTTALGEQLGIEPNVIQVPKSVNPAKNFSVEIFGGVQEVVFNFKKPAGYSVAIYARRANETEFKLLKQVEGKTYIDTRAILNNLDSERRDFCFSLCKNDKETPRSAIYKTSVSN